MKPFLLALAGPSGCGKTTLAKTVAEALGPARCLVVPLDAFYRDLSRLPLAERSQVNFDAPDALDREELRRVLRRLQAGQSIELPVYDFTTHSRHPERIPQAARPLILVEGILAIHMAGDLCDATLYLELNQATCLERRLQRDVRERGRDEAEVRARFSRWVIPSLETWVQPQRSAATRVLDGTENLAEQIAIVKEILPPVLGGPLTWQEKSAVMGSLPPIFSELAYRMGRENLARRLDLQSTHWAGLLHQGEGLLAVERVVPFDAFVGWVLKVTGLSEAGLRGARDLRVEENSVRFAQLPSDLEGYRILQLSDLHLDLETGVLERLLALLPSLDYDLAVITGDFRNSTKGSFTHCIEETARVLEKLRGPVFGILGNHDFVEMVPLLEAAGLPILLNEAICLPVGQARIYLAGIDDPHFYKTHDWNRVTPSPKAQNTLRVLLSHSPETWREAQGRFDWMLSGHTHGGQICLPGGVAIIRNGRCPSDLLAGAWKRGNLQGYTSRGTGCCGVAARFFCPPEITLHTLRCA